MHYALYFALGYVIAWLALTLIRDLYEEIITRF